LNQPTVLWIIAMACLAGAVVVFVWLLRREGRAQPLPPLPEHWPLASRGVFNRDERRTHRVLRETLAHHVILSKLPLVRFCQPASHEPVAYWYDLLGSIHVSFAICTTQGRVVAAIDIDGARPPSRRSLEIKQKVLSACGVAYLRLPAGTLPRPADVQLLVPRVGGGERSPQARPGDDAADIDEARDSLAQTVASRRAQRNALWQDSAMFNDSFFMIDDLRLPDGSTRGQALGDGDPTDVVGIVTDHPRHASRPPTRAG